MSINRWDYLKIKVSSQQREFSAEKICTAWRQSLPTALETGSKYPEFTRELQKSNAKDIKLQSTNRLMNWTVSKSETQAANDHF